MSSLGEGGEQQHGVLDVGNGVGARILRGKHAAGALGGERVIRDRQQERPLPFRAHADDLGFGRLGRARHAGDSEAAHPAGRGVVGMMFSAGSFPDNLRVRPAQASEVDGKGDASEPRGGRRSATFADGNVVGDFERQRGDWAGGNFEDFAVGVEDEMIFDLAADFPVATGSGDGEFLRGAGFELDVKIHGERGGVEGRAEIGGRGGKGEAERRASRIFGFHRHD